MKKKIKLKTIEIESFVTTLNNNEKETVIAASGYLVCSLYLSGCATSLTCKVDPPMEDNTSVRVATRVLNGICNEIRDRSIKYREIGLECPYTAVDPKTTVPGA